MANNPGHDRGTRDQGITAPELRDDTGPVVEERPVAPPPRREPPPRRPGGGAGLLATLLALAAAVLIGLILWSLFDDDDEADRAGAAGVSIDDITDDPARYLGRTVTVGGEVNQILSPRAFVLEGDDLVDGDDLLVVGANEMGGISPDEVVLVSGPVRRFNLAEAERDLGVDLDDNLFRDWADKPAIVARDVDTTPVTAGRAEAVTIDELTDDPQAYRGRLVTTFGTVDRVLGPRAMLIDNSEFFTEDQVLIVARQIPNVSGRPEDASVLNDAPVLVTGTVRPFRLAEVERELGLDLDDNLFRDFDGRSAIVARDITLRPVPAAGAPGAGPVLGVGPLLATPDRYVGQPVTVNGRVTRVVGPNAVVLDNRLLVTARNLPNNLQVGTPLRVTGPFNRFALPPFERDLGVDLNDQLFAEFNNQPAIAATNVVATP